MIAAILIVLATAADPEPCREALANYNDMVVAIHAAIRDYERCVTASLAHDDCGAEFIELQATHRDYEAAVMERADNIGARDARRRGDRRRASHQGVRNAREIIDAEDRGITKKARHLGG